MNEDETPTEPDDTDEPTYQDWTELQAPVACSWCAALVSFEQTEAHTDWHARLNVALENLRAEVQALTPAE